MNQANDNWHNLWDLFEKITLEPRNKHAEILATVTDKTMYKEVQQLLQAHYSQSPVLDSQPQWQQDFYQAFQPPNEIHGYKIQQKLGSGGIGDVYLASKKEDGFERKVAIKFATSGRFAKHVLSSFNTELEVLLSLNHPNIERLYDGGITNDNIPFLIVEYIDGCHIDKYCDENKLNLKQRLKLLQKICHALAAVHRSLIVHRDIKAGNIMVGNDGEPKLLDFGLAKLLETQAQDKDTTLSGLMMTLAYASPEQINSANITTASDIYSLGILLYYLLTGNLPYTVQGNNLGASIKTVTKFIPKLASKNINSAATINKVENKLSKKLSGDLEQIMAKAIAKKPERRYLSALAFANDLQYYLDNKPVIAKQDTVFYRFGKFVQRHRIGVILSSSAVIALVVLSISLFLQSKNLKQSIIDIKQEQQRVIQVTTFLKDMFKVSDPLITDKKIIQVKDLLDYSSQQLDKQFINQPHTKATLYETLGNVYLNMSHLPEADEMFNKADVLFANDSKGKLNMYLAKTRLYQQQSKLKQAQDEIEKLLKQFNFQDLSTQTKAQIEVYQGQNHSKLGNHQQAILDLQSALSKRIKLFGEEHHLVVDIYQLLGNVYWRLGDFKQTRHYYHLGYEINHKTLGETNHKTLKSLSSLGLLAYAQGDFRHALKYFNFVADSRLAKLGKKHILTADAYNRLGVIYFELADYLQAQQKLDIAKEIYVSLNLIETSKYAHTLNNLGLVLRQTKQYQQAQEIFQQVKRINLKTIGENHQGTASTNNNLGMVAADLGNIQQALAFFKLTYDLMLEKHGMKNVRIAFSMTNMARMHLQLNEIEQAKQLLEKALKLRQDTLGKDNIYTIETLSAKVELAIKQNDLDYAKQAIQQVLKIRQKELPKDDWRTAEALNIYAGLNFQAQHNRETIKQFGCSYLQLKDKLGEKHYRVQNSIKRQKSYNIPTINAKNLNCHK